MIISAFAYLVFAGLLVAAAVVDAKTLRIPNALVLGMLGLWVAWRLALGFGGMLVGTDFVTAFVAPAPFKGISFANGIIGSVALGGGLLFVTAVYEAVTKKRAMGGGDIKLLTVVGLFLGLERGVVCLFAACVVSLVFAIVLPHTRWGEKDLTTIESGYPVLRDLPFGPPIAIGAAVALML